MAVIRENASTHGDVEVFARLRIGELPPINVDPQKAAAAIVEMVQTEGVLPLRLPLGADAVAGIREKLAFIASDVDRTEKVAQSTSL